MALSSSLLTLPANQDNEINIETSVKDDESLLPPQCMFEDEDKCLADVLDSSSFICFGCAGMIWIFSSRRKYLACIFVGLVWVSLIIYILVYSGKIWMSPPDEPKSIDFLLALTAFVQLIGLAAVWILNCLRLRRKPRKYEKALFRETMTTTGFSVALTVFISTLPYYIYPPSMPFLPIVFFISAECFLLSMNAQFLLVDAVAIRAVINDLIDKVDKADLSMTDIISSRNEVDYIAQKNNACMLWLLMTAIINVLAAFAMFLLYPPSQSLINATIYLLKEILVGLIGLYAVAVANETSDELVTKIGRQHAIAFDANIVEQEDVSKMKQSKQLDMILLNIQSVPIKFRIAGIVLTRKDVAVQFALWLFGILLSVASQS